MDAALNYFRALMFVNRTGGFTPLTPKIFSINSFFQINVKAMRFSFISCSHKIQNRSAKVNPNTITTTPPCLWFVLALL
jgi:hypothetical protein